MAFYYGIHNVAKADSPV